MLDLQKYIQYVDEFHEGKEQEKQFLETVALSWSKKNEINTTELEHILDFLYQNKVIDVSKITYPHFVAKSEKWNKKLQSVKVIEDDSNGIETILDFLDGFRIVKLVSKESYKKEGKYMSHCVGGYYGRGLDIYSLRDSKNIPHCTIEDGNQIKGKGNQAIDMKYVDYIVRFLESKGMKMRSSEMKNLGYKSVKNLSRVISNKLYREEFIKEDEEIQFKDGWRYGTFQEMIDGGTKIIVQGDITISK